MTPGIHHNIDIDAYHSGPGISKSGLDLIAQSPFHYWSKYLSGKAPKEEAKAGQLEGSLAHCATLEPDEFDSRYAVGPSVRRNTKAWTEFVEAHPGKECIQQDQRDTAFAQAESVRKITDVAAILGFGMPETSAYAIDPETGILCRCRPDWMHPANDTGVILLDLKTYSDASPDEFARQVARKGYEVQDAFYTDTYERASGKEVLAFVFCAVESKYPFAASACMLTPESKESGRIKYRRSLAKYKECQSSGVWPGYGNDINLITLPSWALEQA